MSIYKNIFCLNITMNNIEIMQIQKRLRNNQQKLFCLRFSKTMLRLRQQVIVKRICSTIL